MPDAASPRAAGDDSAPRSTFASADAAPQSTYGRSGRGRGSKQRRGSNGRWVFATMIAAIGLIVGGIGWALILNYRSSSVTPAPPEATGTLHTGQVVSGMCIKEAPDLDAAPSPVEVVTCREPHHAEALLDYTFTSNEWPGTDAATREVVDFCTVQVDPLTGTVPLVPDAPAFTWHAWVPTAATWQLGDRSGLCVVTTDIPVSGSYGSGTARDAAEDAVGS
jgi:hypothetical protein